MAVDAKDTKPKRYRDPEVGRRLNQAIDLVEARLDDIENAVSHSKMALPLKMMMAPAIMLRGRLYEAARDQAKDVTMADVRRVMTDLARMQQNLWRTIEGLMADPDYLTETVDALLAGKPLPHAPAFLATLEAPAKKEEGDHAAPR